MFSSLMKLFNIFILSLCFIHGLEEYSVYYNNDWTPVLRMTQNDVHSVLKDNKLKFGPLPCDCGHLSCNCCVNIRFFKYNRTGCMNFIADPNEFSVGLNMLLDGEIIYENSFSGKNPPPACFMPPIVYPLPLTICVKVYEIFIPEYHLHVCLDLETRFANTPILVLQFDCFVVGRDGISHIKPENSIQYAVIDNNDTNPDLDITHLAI